MIEKGFSPTPAEINLLIQSFCQESRPKDAKKLMEECLNNGCDVNVVNFTTVIHGFCQNKDLETAFSVLDDMYLNNVQPDAVTYTAIIDTLGKNGSIEEAVQMTKKMLHKSLIPTPVTYRVVIHRFCQHGKVDELLSLLEKMLSRQPCKTAYNQVIEKLCSLGNLEEAYKLLGKVLRTASRTDANSCHMLMEHYLRKGDPLSSYKVACRMFSRNLIPDLKLCEKVSKSLVVHGKSHEEDELMLRFVERGKISPKNKFNKVISA
ncbi:pentatricopeptide repeat-containing protein [Tanacetum coccineum]